MPRYQQIDGKRTLLHQTKPQPAKAQKAVAPTVAPTPANEPKKENNNAS